MDTWGASTLWVSWITLLWTWVQRYLLEPLPSVLWGPLKSKIAGLYANSIFSFFGGISILVSVSAAPFYVPANSAQSYNFSISLPTFIFLFLNSNHPDGCEVVSYGFVLILKSDFIHGMDKRRKCWTGWLWQKFQPENNIPLMHFPCCDRHPHLLTYSYARTQGIHFSIFFIVCWMYLDTIPRTSAGWGSYLVCRYLYKRLLRLHSQFPLQENRKTFLFIILCP